MSQILDKSKIERYLRKNLYLNLYSIGDLDDFFWPYTTWYGLESSERLESIIMLYNGPPPPTLLALSDDRDATSQLLVSIPDLLPEKFYAHLSPAINLALNENFDLKSHGLHYKMALRNENMLAIFDFSDVLRFGVENIDEIQDFYKLSYPGNWFDPRMLETKKYYGIKINHQLVCLAGIHVYSPKYRVAALGNIATHPDFRNKGFAAKVTAKLCQTLLKEKLDVGLNVKADNLSALMCYKKIGFEVVAEYYEYLITKKI